MNPIQNRLRVRALRLRASLARDAARDKSAAAVTRPRVAPISAQIQRDFLSAFPAGEASLGEIQALLGRKAAKALFLNWFDRGMR